MNSSSPDSRNRLRSIIDKAGLKMTSHQLNHLWIYYRLMAVRNPRYKLSRISGLTQIAVKHFIDCAMVPELTALPGSILDIGTGAGFPGIVLKILDPSLVLTLAEPRPLRIAFLHEVVRELSLDGVDIHEGKIRDDTTGISVDGVITRALETIPATLRRVRRIIRPEGRVIFMKGPAVDDELSRIHPRDTAGYSRIRDIRYILPTTNHRRRLLIYQRKDVHPS